MPFVCSPISLSSSGAKNVCLYRLDSAKSNMHDIQQLTTITEFKQRDSGVFINHIKWHHTKSQLLMMDPTFLTIWSLNEADTEILGNVDLRSNMNENNRNNLVSKDDYLGGAACWDPHVSSSCAVATYGDIHVIDTRSFDVTTSIIDAHGGNVHDLDYNPSRSNTIITGGDDRLIKIWDLRSTSEPIKILSGHSHWVCACSLLLISLVFIHDLDSTTPFTITTFY